MASEFEAAPASETVADPSVKEQQPAAQPAAASAQTDQKDPSWLGARLDRERKSMLRELGVDKVDDAKAAIAELRKIRDAEKTETERLRSEIETLKAHAERAKTLESVVAIKAKSEMAALTDAQREAVMAIAGEDPGVQLRAVEMLRPTWSAMSQPAPQAPKQAPASTAPAAKAPAASSPESENVLATYERLKATNPYGAARYRLQNLERYTEALKARG